ncbi:hypothetical protein HNQ02_003649, partial [Flavobacterium sp. 7E]|uniref:hypothetical protein n=1 Tax=Flavobacterium sp. 7E TaxID=2735898 RepID=UPI0015709499
MAGGTITRITVGTHDTELSGGMEGFYETFDITAGEQNRLGGDEGTVMDGRIQGSIATSLVIFNKSNLVFFLDNTLNFR